MLASAILASPSDSSAVFALCGGWGTGKTWTAKKIIECVGTRAKVLEFDPWMVSTPDALTREFFLELARGTVGTGDSPEDKDRRTRFWRYAAQIIDLTGAIADPLHVLGVPGAGIVGAAAKGIKNPANLAADGLSVLSAKPSLRESRDRLSAELAKSNHVTLIVIDDIDRLADDEIRVLFRLLKACADFPNVKYLLVFDRPHVKRSLDDAFGSGEDFLDKIITSTFDLPEMTTEQRARKLDNAIEAMLASIPHPTDERISFAFHNVLLPGLTTFRTIDNYCRTANTILFGLKHPEGIDCDISDFLTLEFLRQRYPSVYAVLLSWSSPAPGGPVRQLGNGEEFLSGRMRELQNSKPKIERERILVDEALSLLQVPNSERSDQYDFGGTEADHILKRFRSEVWRSAYFGFNAGRAILPSVDFSQLKMILEGNQTIHLETWLERLNDYQLRIQIVWAVIARLGELTSDSLGNLLVALFEWGEQRQYDSPVGSIVQDSCPYVVALLGSAILMRARPRGSRLQFFSDMAERSSTLLGPAMLVGYNKIRTEDTIKDSSCFTQDEMDILRPDWFTRVDHMLSSGEIWNHINSRDIYAAYSYLYIGDHPYQWFDSLHSDEGSLASWVNKILPTYVQPDGKTHLRAPESAAHLAALYNLPDSLLSESGRAALTAYFAKIESDKRHEGDVWD